MGVNAPPLTAALVIVVPSVPALPCGPCGPVAPKPLKSNVVPSYVKSLPLNDAMDLLCISGRLPVNATGDNCVLLLF